MPNKNSWQTVYNYENSVENILISLLKNFSGEKWWIFKNNFIPLHLENYTQFFMATFIGKYDAKADIKGRIFVPSAYRKLLPNDEKERIVMRKDADNDCIIFYPEHVWNKKVNELRENLDEWNPEDQMLLLAFTEDAEWLDIDSQGRVLLSKKNQQAIHLTDNEVLFIGMIDRFAVWSKSRYEQAKISPSDLASRLRERMMKKQAYP